VLWQGGRAVAGRRAAGLRQGSRAVRGKRAEGRGQRAVALWQVAERHA